MKEVDPKEMCSLFGMCTCEYNNIPGDTMLPSLSTSQDIPGVCHLCTLLVKKIFELTIGNQTEAAIVLAMETVSIFWSVAFLFMVLIILLIIA